MNTKVKKILAVLLSAVMMMSVAFVSTAAGPRYERPEIGKADTVKTTGTWNKDANGFWSLTSDSKKVSGGWYYANMVNSSTEYRWFYLDEKGIMATGWVIDKKDPSIWYYTSEIKDRTEGSMVTGWVTDPQDGQKYYLSPEDGIMYHGWHKIDNSWYCFAERKDANRSWAPDANGYWSPANKTGHSYGSLYRNEMTPDGYYVDGTGAWRQSSGSSSGSSTRRNPDQTPTPDPVMTATASTTTPQHAGQPFNTEGLKITVFKDGAEYPIVTLPDDDKIPAEGIKVTVNGVENGTLLAGLNEVKIEFVYYDPDVIIGQSITADVFTVDAKVKFTVDSEGTTVEFSPGLLYWDGTDSKFKFETTQATFRETWDSTHVNHFYWSKDASVAVAETYSDLSAATTDKYFTEQSGFTVNGETGKWRNLSSSEWDYLVNARKINGGTTSGYGKTCKRGTLSGVNGLIIAHDNYTGDFSDASAAVADGCVFLPAAGYRNGTSMYYVGSDGRYWSSTPYEHGADYAYSLYFDVDYANTSSYYRRFGRCVRLVK